MDRPGSPAAEAPAKSRHAGCVTGDIEQARKVFAERPGLDSFAACGPAPGLLGADGPLVTRLTASFTTTDSRVPELMQPPPGMHPMSSGPLAGAGGDVRIFHHAGTQIPDAKAAGAFPEPAGESGLPAVPFELPDSGAGAAFADMTGVAGHWLDVLCVRRHS